MKKIWNSFDRILKVLIILTLLGFGLLIYQANKTQNEQVEAKPPSVTENYLRRGVAIATAPQIAFIVGDELLGPLHNNSSHVTPADSSTWDKDKTIRLTYITDSFDGKHRRHLPLEIRFTEPSYATGGAVNEHGCQTLPGTGTVSSGLYRTFDNTNGTDIIEEHFSEEIVETTERTTELSESITLGSSTTVEAGTSFGAGNASISETISLELGISHSETDDMSTTVDRTLGFDTMAQIGQKDVIVITINEERLKCLVTINGIADWGRIEIIGKRVREMDIGVDWHNVCHHQPTSYSGWCKFRAHDSGFYIHKEDVVFAFDEGLDGLLRLSDGNTTDVPPGFTFNLSDQAKASQLWLENGRNRWVTLHGSRTSASQKNASYKSIDASGVSSDCIKQNFGTSGQDLILDC